MTAGGSWGCFSGPWQLCWPKKRCRAPRLDAPDAQQLPDLDEACAEVQRSDGRALLRRRVQVTAKLLPVASKIAWQQFTGSDTAVANTRRLRMVLEALGPAFVKLGQAAACREDILSEAVAKELRKLCDQVAPFDHSEAQRLIPVGTAGLQPPAPDPSGHCRTSSASSRSQWALPDSIRERQIPVGTAGLQPSAPDPSGHCRTSSASSRCQWALPDFNRELQIPVGTAGLKNVEHHPQVGADATARYNCYTSAGSLPPPGAKIIDLWSNPHKIWCCENMGVACATSSTTQMPTTWIMVPVPDFKEGVKGVPAIAGADGMVPFAATFHCHVGIPTGWSQEQQDFCCKHVNIGCKMAVPPEPNCELSATNDPMHWLPSKREWCCAKHQTGCLQVPAVLGMAGAAACEGDPVAWDEAQKTYCCTTTGLGCTTAPPASSELYDCTIGFATWQDDWSTSHQEWCCTHHGRACA
eukprot:s473_g28.t1